MAKIVEKALRGATGKPARRIKQKPSDALRTDNVTEAAEGSATRITLAKIGGETKGRASTLVDKLVALNKIADKKSEKATLLQNAINDLTKGKNALPPSVVKTSRAKATEKINKTEGADLNKQMEQYKKNLVESGKYTKTQIKEMDEAGMFNKGGMAKKKVQMMRGGMANKKEHMYAAGGSVMDNLTSGQKKMVMSMAKANKK